LTVLPLYNAADIFFPLHGSFKSSSAVQREVNTKDHTAPPCTSAKEAQDNNQREGNFITKTSAGFRFHANVGWINFATLANTLAPKRHPSPALHGDEVEHEAEGE
jgi:hypothetical protein